MDPRKVGNIVMKEEGKMELEFVAKFMKTRDRFCSYDESEGVDMCRNLGEIRNKILPSFEEVIWLAATATFPNLLNLDCLNQILS